jgi:hypothetical protein
MIDCDEELLSHPIVDRVRSQIEGINDFRFLDHRPLFEAIFQSDFALRALKLALQRIAQNPDYQIGNFVMDGLVNGWSILATEHFRVSIGHRSADWPGFFYNPALHDRAAKGDAPTTKLEPYPFDLFLGVMAVGSLSLDRYTVVDAAAPGGVPSLEFAARHVLRAGDALLLKAGADVTYSELKGSFVYLEIAGLPTSRLLPRFDPKTRAFAGWISGDPTASRFELLTRTLADLDYKPGAAAMERLTEHRDHFVRWNTMRHLLRLDEDAGIRRVRHAAQSDAHADVRDIAARTLAAIAQR